MTQNNAAQAAEQEARFSDDQLMAIATAAWQVHSKESYSPDGLLMACVAVQAALLSKLRAPVAGERDSGAVSQFLTDVMTAAGLVEHGKRCKALAERLGKACMDLRLSTALASAPVAGEALGWRVRERRGRDGELLDCFVEAPAAPGMAYAQEVLGDDYAEAQGGIEGKLKHCQMIVAWANAAPQASEAQCSCPSGNGSLRHPCAVHGGFKEQPSGPGQTLFTYSSQPCRNEIAWRFGEACSKAAHAPAGDYIDRGLVLLKELQAKGYGIAALSAQPGAQRTGGSDAG